MNLGFIGIGIMGESMSENLLKKTEHTLFVCDMNEEQVRKLVSKGATATSSASELVEKSDIIFTMLPRDEHVRSVYNSFLQVVKEDQVFIDMSTISPKVSREIARLIEAKQATMLDAPVVKSKAAAIEGSLGIYVGGNREAYNKVKDLLLCIGSNIIYLGDNGQGLVMKLIHNMLVAQIQNGVNEMILLSQKVGIKIEDFIEAISYGGGQNFYLDTKAKSISEGNFNTAFSVENMHKDVHLADDLIAELGIKLPGTKHVLSIYDKSVAANLGKEDFSATFKTVKEWG